MNGVLYDAKLNDIFKKDEYAEDIYRRYHVAKKAGQLDAFLATLDVPRLRYYGMWISELFGSISNTVLYEAGSFNTGGNIAVVKHACYMPAFTHSHEFYEMIFVYKGYCINIIEGEHLSLHKGDMCIISPSVTHSVEVSGESVVINILIKHSTFLDNFGEFLSTSNTISDFFLKSVYGTRDSSYLLIRDMGDDTVMCTFEQLIYEGLSEQSFYSRGLTDSLLKTTFYYILKEHPEYVTVSCAPIADPEKANQILSYIYYNYLTVTLENLATEFNYSVPYMSRLIKKRTGRNFASIIQETRMKQACMMLKQDTFRSVDEIGKLVGYSKVDSFYKAFRIYTGSTPGKYRQQTIT